MICKNAKICEVREDCPHGFDHKAINETDNSCSIPCDVNDGVAGSTCIESEKE